MAHLLALGQGWAPALAHFVLGVRTEQVDHCRADPAGEAGVAADELQRGLVELVPRQVSGLRRCSGVSNARGHQGRQVGPLLNRTCTVRPYCCQGKALRHCRTVWADLCRGAWFW